MPINRSIPVVVVIVVSAIVTGVALHLLIGDKRTDVGGSVTRGGITVTLQSVHETQTGTELMFLVSDLPMDPSLGWAVGIIADQGRFKFNGDYLDKARVSKRVAGPHEVSLRIGFDTSAGTTAHFQIGRIYVLFSEGEGGGDDRFIEGPWSFRFRTPEGPYR